MINLYIIDYHNPSQENGLNTNIKQLGQQLTKDNNVRTHYVWTNYKGSERDFTKITKDNGIHYYFRGNIAVTGNSSTTDLKVAEYLTTEMNGSENNIIHFNWVNQCLFAYFLKQKVKCKTVLTKQEE